MANPVLGKIEIESQNKIVLVSLPIIFQWYGAPVDRACQFKECSTSIFKGKAKRSAQGVGADFGRGVDNY